MAARIVMHSADDSAENGHFCTSLCVY